MVAQFAGMECAMIVKTIMKRMSDRAQAKRDGSGGMETNSIEDAKKT